MILIKLNGSKAEDLLSRVLKLEQLFVKKFKITVNFTLLKDYLKIFAFQVNEPKLFIENFTKLSIGKFDLTQILKAFEDQCVAQEIYIEFKNT